MPRVPEVQSGRALKLLDFMWFLSSGESAVEPGMVLVGFTACGVHRSVMSFFWSVWIQISRILWTRTGLFF